MYIVKNTLGEEIQADFVMQGRQFPVLHIHTHTCTPIHAYEVFQVNNEIITATEIVYATTEDTQFDWNKTYYEQAGIDYVATADVEMQEGKTYYEEQVLEPVVYEGYTRIHSVGESPFMPEYGEILIWLQKG